MTEGRKECWRGSVRVCRNTSSPGSHDRSVARGRWALFGGMTQIHKMDRSIDRAHAGRRRPWAGIDLIDRSSPVQPRTPALSSAPRLFVCHGSLLEPSEEGERGGAGASPDVFRVALTRQSSQSKSLASHQQHRRHSSRLHD